MGQDRAGGERSKCIQSANLFFENTWEISPLKKKSEAGGISLAEMFISLSLAVSVPQEMNGRKE